MNNIVQQSRVENVNQGLIQLPVWPGPTGKYLCCLERNDELQRYKILANMITVNDMLERKAEAINTIEPTALIIDALTMLDKVNLSYLVVKEGDSYRGIFCERDYCRNVVLKGRSSRDNRVEEVMTTDLPVVQLDDTAEFCMNSMTTSKTRYLLAYDGRDFAGVITIHDLLRQVIASKENVFDHSLAEELLTHDEGGKVY